MPKLPTQFSQKLASFTRSQSRHTNCNKKKDAQKIYFWDILKTCHFFICVNKGEESWRDFLDGFGEFSKFWECEINTEFDVDLLIVDLVDLFNVAIISTLTLLSLSFCRAITWGVGGRGISLLLCWGVFESSESPNVRIFLGVFVGEFRMLPVGFVDISLFFLLKATVEFK